MYTILHIADLHRTPEDVISNETLLAAFVQDFERQRGETPSIGDIDAILISGDIVHGVDLGIENYEELLNNQYEYARTFLNDMTERFLNGDRSKIIISPGNHDINWNVAFESMRPVDERNESVNLRGVLLNSESNYRFDLNRRILFEIVDSQQYDQKLNAFRRFVESFYDGCELEWGYDPNSDWNIFTLDDANIFVASFNSCSRNDCFCDVGKIGESVIGETYLAIRDSGKPFRLIIGLWHHGINGPPERSDFMDRDTVLEMASHDFRLGLHGHNHSPGVSIERVWAPTEAQMAIVGVGSLCAGHYHLPTGQRRQYNIIEIRDDYAGARVHVRQLYTGNSFAPLPLHEFGGNSYKDFTWSELTSSAGTLIDSQVATMNSLIEDAESAYATGEYGRVATLLSDITDDLPNHGRRLLLESLQASGNDSQLIDLFNPPTSIEELIPLITALENMKEYRIALSTLENFKDELQLSDADYHDLERRITVSMELTNE